MTRHLLPEHTAQDQATVRRLALVIAVFIASAIAL